jgi:hypothetical protein
MYITQFFLKYVAVYRASASVIIHEQTLAIVSVDVNRKGIAGKRTHYTKPGSAPLKK